MHAVWSAPVAFVLTAALLPVVVWVLRHLGVLDEPSLRSSHRVAVPRGAGVALGLGITAAALGFGAPWYLAVGAAGYCLLGALDDWTSLGARVRLVVQAALAVGICWGLGLTSEPALLLAAAIAVIATVNAVNFMDGINGISAFHAMIWGVAYGVLATQLGPLPSSSLFWALFGAGLAFLPWNVPGGHVFLGDSGSYVIGAVAALGLVTVWMSGHALAAVAPLTIYALDTFQAVASHLVRRRSMFTAHRDHVYQRLVDAGWSHLRASSVTAACSAACALVGIATLYTSVEGTAIDALLLTSIGLLYLMLPALMNRSGRPMEVRS